IVRQSGGEITIASDVGRGTTFDVFLPEVAAPETVATSTAAPVPLNVSGQETILLVEDEEIVRGMLAEILRAHGYKVLEAGNGKQALEISRNSEDFMHLLVTDMLMPEMNGS